jgi:SAM-dependent methyltransferase
MQGDAPVPFPVAARSQTPARCETLGAVTARTWHYGVVARWWAEFNTTGPEIDYFRRYVEAGQPALDLACGAGRLLLPYLREGLDVDGADVSADMLALCREAAEREGLSPNLYAQPKHELDLPRRYRTIFMCGALGVGSTRAEDMQALERVYEHLEPGGTFVLDNEAPYAEGNGWKYWEQAARTELPRPRRPPGERKVGSDGAEYELRSRVLDLDPLEQRMTMAMHALMWRDGELVAEDEHELTLTLYFKDEILLMLERAGFVDLTVAAALTDAEPTGADDFLVFTARRPPELPSADARE